MIPLNEFYEKNQTKMLNFLDTISLLKDKKGCDGDSSRMEEIRPFSPHSSGRLSPSATAVAYSSKSAHSIGDSITSSASETVPESKPKEKTRYALLTIPRLLLIFQIFRTQVKPFTIELLPCIVGHETYEIGTAKNYPLQYLSVEQLVYHTLCNQAIPSPFAHSLISSKRWR